MAEIYKYDIFIAYHGTGTTTGTVKVALDLYSYLKKKLWHPYMYQAMETDLHFTDTSTITPYCGTFVFVVNQNVPLNEEGKLRSKYLNKEISSFLAAERPDNSLTALIVKGFDVNRFLSICPQFKAVPSQIGDVTPMERMFEAIDALMERQLGYRRKPAELPVIQKTDEVGLYRSILFDKALSFSSRADQEEEIFHCEPEIAENYILLLKAMMHDSKMAVREVTTKDPAVNYLLHVGEISKEFCRHFFYLAYLDPECKEYLPYLLQVAKFQGRSVFINFFARSNLDLRIYPRYLSGGEEELPYDEKMTGHNEKKMRLTSFEDDVTPPFDYGLTYSSVYYSDYVKFCRLDYPFTDAAGRKVTMRSLYVNRHSGLNLFSPQATLELPNECGCGVFIITSDNYLILQKRNNDSKLMFYPDLYGYSASGSIDMDADDHHDGSFIPRNGIEREAGEELGTDLGSARLSLVGFGFDNDVMFYQFSFLALSSERREDYEDEIRCAKDGLGREIAGICFIDLTALYERGSHLDASLLEILRDPKRWDHAANYCLKRLLRNQSVREWVGSPERDGDRRVINFQLPDLK